MFHILRFHISSPPRHGLILNGIYGSINHYKQLSPLVFLQDLQVHRFTMDELKQGLFGIRYEKNP